MKTFNIKSSILSLVALFFVATMAHAQFDDIYYSNASDDSQFVEAEEQYIAEARDDYGFSSFDEDDGYYYTSRIRRFSNPSRTIGYFSPIYTNSFNYGGFSPFGFSNSFVGNGVRVIGNNAIVTNSFGNSFITPVNRVGFGNSFGRIGGSGFSNAYLCPPVGGFTNTQNFNRPVANSRNVSTVSSVRRSGSTAGSTAGQTRTARTARSFRTNSSSTNSVRTSPRSSSTRSSTKSFSSPRSSSSRSFRSSGSSSSSRGSVRSSSRGARG